VVALPLAFAAQGWETALNWWRAQNLFAIEAAANAEASYAGARWWLEKLSLVATRRDGMAVVAAEMAATVTDPAQFALLPSIVVLTGPGLPQWLPVFATSREIRKARPDLSERPTCGAARLDGAEAGATLRMAETFAVPAGEFEKLRVEISLPSGRPDYLVLHP
jgi:hypothetical protein